MMATQAFGDEDYDEETEPGSLTWLESGQSAGHAIDLPGNVGVDILVLGRDVQPLQRLVEGASLGVQTLQLTDAALGSQPFVSGVHAEISYIGSELMLTSLGRSYSFINGLPYHATSKLHPRGGRLFDGDVIRIGGNLSGRPGGDYSKFVLRVDHPPLGERPAASPPSPPLPASAGATPAGPKLVATGGEVILLDALPRSRTMLPGGGGFIASTRCGHFDLHIQGGSVAVSYQHGSDAAQTLGAGQQRRLRDGDVLSLDELAFTCVLPTPPPAAAPQSGGSNSADAAKPTAAKPAVATRATPALDAAGVAAELSAMAQRQAELTAGLVGGLAGKARSEAVRSLSAAHAAHVGVALAAAAGGETERAARVGANQLSKVANDQDKKRRREAKAAAVSASRAQRRDTHPAPRAPVGRAPGAPRAQPAKRDRRTFEGRTVARKKQRVAADERRQQPPPPPARTVRIEYGKGGGGGGKGGGKHSNITQRVTRSVTRLALCYRCVTCGSVSCCVTQSVPHFEESYVEFRDSEIY